jgi:outer membrane usher protein FimD/PapC
LVGGTHRFYDTGERSTSLFAGFGKQIGGSTSLRVSGSRLYEGDQESWGVQISLVSRPFGGRGSYGTTYNARREELDLAGAYGLEGRRADGTIGVKAQGLDTESYEPRSVSGSFQGSLPQAEGYFAATSTTVGGGISGAPESVRLTGQVGTGLYFADGLLGFGRPSTDSFVLVGKSRTLAGGEILVNPTDRGAEARSGIIGAATLPSVGEYRAKPIRAEVSGVPVDYALGPTAYIVESGHRTGTAIRITGSKLLYGTGRLLDETGAPVALQVFEVRRKDQRVLSSFTDEEGRFLLYDLEPGEYTLAVPGLRKVEAMLRLSEDRVSPFDVGELYLQEERGK